MKTPETPTGLMTLRALCVAAATSVFGWCLGSCNTVAGFGADLRMLGGKMEDKATETGGATPPVGY